MNKKTFRWLWALTLIAAFGIGCSLVTNVTERVGGIEKTAQSVATGVQSGREIISTGQAIVTNVQGNPMVQTAQAYVTAQGPGVEKTVQVFPWRGKVQGGDEGVAVEDDELAVGGVVVAFDDSPIIRLAGVVL